jgi:hypothetical protein
VPPQLLSVDLKNFDTSTTSTYVPVIKNNQVCVDIHDLTTQPSKVGNSDRLHTIFTRS